MTLRSDPSIRVEPDGTLTLSWPLGRSGVVEVEASVLEELVARANVGQRAIRVLGDIAAALGRLATPDASQGGDQPVPSAATTTGEPSQQADTP